MTKKNEKSAKVQGTNVQVTEVENKVQSSNLVSEVYEGGLAEAANFVQVEIGSHVEKEQAASGKEDKYSSLSYEDIVRQENALSNNYKNSTKVVKYAVDIYRRSLVGALDAIRKCYYFGNEIDGLDIDVKKHIDTICRISRVDIIDLFDASFVSKLFDTYTFNLTDGSGVQTLKSVKCRKTEKTDYIKLGASAEKWGFSIDIEASEHTEKDIVYYWRPISNFSVSLIFKHVFVLNSQSMFRIEKEALKAAARKAAKKARKAAKKAEKAKAGANTEETK